MCRYKLQNKVINETNRPGNVVNLGRLNVQVHEPTLGHSRGER